MLFFVLFCFKCNKYFGCKKKVTECVFLKHESASAVCVFGNSQRAETSTRSEWTFRTAPALFQDSAVPALALAPALVLVLVRSLAPLDTSHRLALPLWAEQSPCGSWHTGKDIRSCHKPAGLCCPAGRSLRGNLQATEELDWEVLADSALPW